jgi:hypothetical protein
MRPEYFVAGEFFDYDDSVDDLRDVWQTLKISGSDIADIASIANHKSFFNLFHHLFGWAETTKRILSVTTQFACGRVSDTLKSTGALVFWHVL